MDEVGEMGGRWVGRFVGDQFRVLRRLPEGDLGPRVLARHSLTRREVVIELICHSLLMSDPGAERLLLEARAMVALRHPNIVRTHRFGRLSSDRFYLVRDHVEGRTLADVLGEEGRMLSARALRIVDQLCSALMAAHHRGIVHRGLGPDVILLVEAPDHPDHVCLVHLGIAQILSRSGSDLNLTGTAALFGKAPYMSPEQIQSMPVDGRSDLYAVGALLHHMLTGRPPFEASTPTAVFLKHLTEPVMLPTRRFPELELHPWIEELITSCLVKDPSGRVGSAEELQDAVRSILEVVPEDLPGGLKPLTVDILEHEGPLAVTPAAGRLAVPERAMRSTPPVQGLPVAVPLVSEEPVSATASGLSERPRPPIGVTSDDGTFEPGAAPDLSVAEPEPSEAPKEPEARKKQIPSRAPSRRFLSFPYQAAESGSLLRVVLLLLLMMAVALAVAYWTGLIGSGS